MSSVLDMLDTYSQMKLTLPTPTVCDLDGRALYSWRFTIYPFLFAEDLGGIDFSRSWDSAPNSEAAKRVNWYFCSDPSSTATSVVGLTGSGTAFDLGSTVSLKQIEPDAIVLLESYGIGLHWMEPGDLVIGQIPRTIGAKSGVRGATPGGFLVGFADGEVWRLRNDIPFSVLEQFFTVQGAKEADRSRALSPYRMDVPRSAATE